MSSFRALLARPGVLPLAAASGIGWWAFNGYGLALVLTIHHATGSFAIAGASTAAFGIGSAVLAPLRGRAVDRGGPPVLRRLAAVHVGALGVIVAAGSGARPAAAPAALLAASAIAGASAPPITAAARRAWGRLAGPELARAAHALNALLGETAGLASPVVTSLLASAATPAAALAVLLPGTAAAAVGVARAVDPPPPAADATTPAPGVARARSILRDSPGLRWLVAGDVVSGLWLGALEVTAPALGDQAGTPALVGAPLFGLAVGGIAATLWTGSTRAAGSPVQRYVWGAAAVACTLPPALVMPGLAALALAAIGAGVGYGLINVALFELIDHVADDARAMEAFTWITTAQASGIALGAAMAGALADAGPGHALVLTCAAPALGAAAALGGRRTLRDAAALGQVQPST